MPNVMVNYDLKREDGIYTKTSLKDLNKILKDLTDDVDDKSIVTIMVEVRKEKEFKIKDKDRRWYKLKGPKGA